MKKLLILILALLSLEGCVAFLGGAAIGTAGTSAVVYDRREGKTIMNDENMSYQVTQKLQENAGISSRCHVSVTTYNSVLLLMGQAPTQELKNEITEMAKTIPGVKRIYNEMTIEAPTTTLIRTNDTWLTTKVKSVLLGTKGLKSGQFKVVTENGTVFLMGIVSHEQAKVAVDQARGIEGVQKVATVFQYTQPLVTPTAEVPPPKTEDAGKI